MSDGPLKTSARICSCFFFFPERNRRYSHWLHLFLEQGGGRRKEIGKKKMQTYGLIQFDPGEKCPSQHVRVKTGPVVVTLPSEPRNLVLRLIVGRARMPGWDLKPTKINARFILHSHTVFWSSVSQASLFCESPGPLSECRFWLQRSGSRPKSLRF